MKNINVLPIIYKDVIGKEIDINNEDNRDILQKLVYLLSELRIFVEEYKFTYDKNVGPFSQSLENDIMEIKTERPFDELTANSNEAISFLKEEETSLQHTYIHLHKFNLQRVSLLYGFHKTYNFISIYKM